MKVSTHWIVIVSGPKKNTLFFLRLGKSNVFRMCVLLAEEPIRRELEMCCGLVEEKYGFVLSFDRDFITIAGICWKACLFVVSRRSFRFNLHWLSWLEGYHAYDGVWLFLANTSRWCYCSRALACSFRQARLCSKNCSPLDPYHLLGPKLWMFFEVVSLSIGRSTCRFRCLYYTSRANVMLSLFQGYCLSPPIDYLFLSWQ
jgi:hypothetical protein